MAANRNDKILKPEHFTHNHFVQDINTKTHKEIEKC